MRLDAFVAAILIACISIISSMLGYTVGKLDGVESVEIPSCSMSCPSCLAPDCWCSLTCPSCPEQSQLQRIAYDVAEETPYNGTISNDLCKDKSLELVRRLKNAGYDAYTRCGQLLPYGYHMWVEVDNIMIESTSGDILSPDRYADRYVMKGC